MIYFQSAAVHEFITGYQGIKLIRSYSARMDIAPWVCVLLGGDDGVQFPDGVLHRVVDDEIIVGVGRLELHLGPQQTLLHFLRIIGAPVLQTALSSFQLGGR